MRITQLTVSNFRCFGPEGVTVGLDNLVALIGANSSGKTSVLQAIYKLFSSGRPGSQILKSDFHVPPGNEDPTERDLSIEARIEFPEFVEGEEDPSIPAFFNQLRIESEATGPYCRLRLKATWTQAEIVEGEITTELQWITSPPDANEERTVPATKGLRPRVSVSYVPANRDPSSQLRQTTGSVLHRLFRSIRWSNSFSQALDTAANELADRFGEQEGVSRIKAILNAHWEKLHGSRVYSEVELSTLSSDILTFLKGVTTTFSPNNQGEPDDVHELSDGLQSLFYISLITAMAEIDSLAFDAQRRIDQGELEEQQEEEEDEGEEEIGAEEDDNEDEEGEERVPFEEVFNLDELRSPLLTLLAVEEPENHLSPHYLGRIMQSLLDIAEKPTAQVILASHSPSILSRVEPSCVRHLFHDEESSTSRINVLPLPEDDTDEEKFVREAVRIFPELYFARCVILGEGASEEIVLRRLLSAYGLPSDRSSISIVPLGGRHVNHLWRLLHSLEIPYFTVVDLDLGRETGGSARIGVLSENLSLVDRPLTDENDETIPAPETFEDRDALEVWVEGLQGWKIFMSSPLDLDLEMLRAFPQAYEALELRGPSIPDSEDEEYQKKVEAVNYAVLGEESGEASLYSDDERALFWRYRYHFLTRSKPATHLLALNSLSDAEIRENCPPYLRALVDAIASELSIALAGAQDG